MLPPFKSPPIAEAWVGFTFELPQASLWNTRVAGRFLAHFESDFPLKQEVSSETVETEESPAGREERSRTTALDVVRVFSEDGTRAIQLRASGFSYHHIRGGSECPGFDAVRLKALSIFGAYKAFFSPVRLKNVDLVYRDIIDIPLGADGGLVLNEWFNVGLSAPASFGTLSEIRHQAVYSGSHGLPFLLHFQTMEASEKLARFKLDWRVALNDPGESAESIEVGLAKARETLHAAFEDAMTDKSLALFL